jgi:hypothetical protein
VSAALTDAINTRSGSKPSGTVINDENVLRNRPAPTTSTTDSATCSTIKAADGPKNRPPSVGAVFRRKEE